MLGGADNPNGELPSYITGADIVGQQHNGTHRSVYKHCCLYTVLIRDGKHNVASACSCCPWLTTVHKTPYCRGDGSRSGPSPCKARRDITPLDSLVTSFIIGIHLVPGFRPGATRF